MLTEDEELFFDYWKKNRLKKKNLLRQLLPGFVIGLSIGAAILISLDLDWYKRANMVAATEMNPYILLLSITAISVFAAFFYKKHRWEMNEQLYTELKFKKDK